MKLINLILLSFFLITSCASNSEKNEDSEVKIREKEEEEKIIPGADQMNQYLPIIKDKTIAIVTNHTAVIGQTHLVDSLHSLGVNIKMVFAPEHGFRGDAPDGQKINDDIDESTGIPIISLYGKLRKPTSEMLEGVDYVVFDIQDVGARFYTFITTMHRTMEAAAENNVPYIVLDRPNPNGNYVDGPIRQDSLISGVSTHPIPIVHGLTVGELATMINGEGWMDNKIKVDLTVIKAKNYRHSDEYILPIKPSPNLPTQLSVILYPSLCLFEGTVISVGRGTYEAFQQLGHPDFKGLYEHSFTPKSIPNMSTSPKFKDQICYGIDFSTMEVKRELTLKYLLKMYNQLENKEGFFRSYFHKLEGSGLMMQQIKDGVSEEDIRKTWEPGLSEYKEMRKKYLLYEL